MAQKLQLKRHLLIIILILVPHTRTQEEEEAAISAGAEVTAVKEGDNAEIECSTTENQTLLWFKGASTTENKIPEDSSLRVFANITTGLLTIQAAMLNDSGEYLCQTANGSLSITTELHVYVMPTYFTEGMIVLGIIAALLVLLAVLSIHSLVKSRRQSKQNKIKHIEKMRQSAADPETSPVTVEM